MSLFYKHKWPLKNIILEPITEQRKQPEVQQFRKFRLHQSVILKKSSLTLFVTFTSLIIMEVNESKTNENISLKHAESALNGISPGLLPNLMHNLPGMAYRCKNDSQWSMLFISEGCIDLTGYRADDLIDNSSLSYSDLIYREDRQLVRSVINDAIKKQTQYQLEYRIVCKSGTIKWVWEKGNAVYDLNRNTPFLDGLIMDVSSRHKAEEKLKQAAEELANLNIKKDRFFSLVAHDLQNPVYAIISLSEFAAENYESFDRAQIEDAFLQVNSAARGIFTLLENLLDWAKLQTGQMQVQKEILSITKTVEYAIEHYRKSFTQKDIEIVFEHEEECMVESDIRMLSSIFRNLISNALKYSHPHSKIIVQLRCGRDRIWASVKDNGIGISRRHLQNLFSIDNELREYGTANESGSGLGLILVDNFVRLLGGEIQVESKLSHGTEFSLTLPGRI